MSIVAKVLAHIVNEYFEGIASDDRESRLLIPAPTKRIGFQLQEILLNSNISTESFLIIDSDSDDEKPDANKGWMHANGLTSKRIGSFIVISQPGQLSRIQESVVGSGGAVRQSFEDEWPWANGHEIELFSFEDVILPRIVDEWVSDQNSSEIYWIKNILLSAIFPAVRKSASREIQFFDHLIDGFDPSANAACGNIRQRFLYHCGLPRWSNDEQPCEPEEYIEHTAKVSKAIANLMQQISRRVVIENSKDIAEIDGANLESAVNSFYDGLAHNEGKGSDSLSIANLIKRLSPSEWKLLTIKDILPKLFEIQGSSKLEMNATISSENGFQSANKSSLIDVQNSEILVSFDWKIEGDSDPKDFEITLKLNRREIHKFSNLESSMGSSTFTLQSNEEYLQVSPQKKISLNASKRVLTVKLTNTLDPTGTVSKSAKVHFYLLSEKRQALLVAQNSLKKFAVIDIVGETEEENPIGIELDEPTYVYCFDIRENHISEINISGEPTKLVEDKLSEYRTPSTIDPGFEASGQTPVYADFGDLGRVYLNYESIGKISGMFSLEGELVDRYKASDKSKIADLLRIFSGESTIPYSGLGGITDERKLNIFFSKRMENPINGALPIVVDFSQSPDSGSLSLYGQLYLVDNVNLTKSELSFEDMCSPAQDLLTSYTNSRQELLNIYQNHFADNEESHKHPLHARCPTYISSRENDIEIALEKYLESYKNILSYLSKPDSDNWNEAFVLSYLDCVVSVRIGENLKSTNFLLGPWHPVVVAERYQCQSTIYLAINNSSNTGPMNKLATVLTDLDGMHRIHALSDEGINFENAYVSGTGDIGWRLALKIKDAAQLVLQSELLATAMGLDISLMPRGTEAFTSSFAKRYLEANPAERRLEVRVREGLDGNQIVNAFKNLIYDSKNSQLTKYGRRLSGGIHIYFEKLIEDEIDDLEWSYPPICIYEDSNEEHCLEKNSIDILIVAPSKKVIFKPVAYKDVSPLPRGIGKSSYLTSTVTWLESGESEVASSVCHEVDNPTIASDNRITNSYLLVNEYVSKLVIDSFHTIRPLNIPKDINASWVIIPGTHSDPSVFTQYVIDSESDSDSHKVLWEYSVDLEQRQSEYYILSEISKGFSLAINSTGIPNVDAELITHDLGSIGIAVGGEALRTGNNALGVIGLVGAARMLSAIGGNSGSIRPPLRDSETEVGLLLPVDSFDSLLGTSSSLKNIEEVGYSRKSDLLAIQLRLLGEKRDVLSISASSIECKYTGGTYGEVPSALDQAQKTYNRFKTLFDGSCNESGMIERLILTRLIRYGLQLKHEPQLKSITSFERDRLILSSILCGKLQYIEPQFEAVLISTEIKLKNSESREIDAGLWVRLAKTGWPTTLSNSPQLLQCKEKLSGLFNNGTVAAPATNNSTSQENENPEAPATTPVKISIEPKVNESDQETNKSDGIVSHRNDIKPTKENNSVPTENLGIKFVVGQGMGSYAMNSYEYWPSNTELTQLNMGIVGDLGTGKTQLLKALMLNMHRSKGGNRGVSPKFLIIDYNEDFIDEDFVQAMDATVIEPRNIPLNFLDSGTTNGEGLSPAINRTRFVYDTLKKIYAGLGPVQEMNLRKSMKEGYRLAESAGRKAPTLDDICREYSNIVKGKADAMLAILSGMVDLELFETNDEKILTLENLFSKSLVLNLKSLGQDDKTKNILVAIFLNIYYEYVLSLSKKDFLGTDPSLRFVDSILVVDEADSIMKYNFPILKTILLQGRKFGVGVWLASQYMSHFKANNEDYKQNLLTWFIHNVPNITANELSDIRIVDKDRSTTNKIRQLGKFECFCTTLNIPGKFMKGSPFYKMLDNEDE